MPPPFPAYERIGSVVGTVIAEYENQPCKSSHNGERPPVLSCLAATPRDLDPMTSSTRHRGCRGPLRSIALVFLRRSGS